MDYSTIIYSLSFISSNLDALAGTLGLTLQIAAPLLITAMAGMMCERSGVVDIGLEGKLILSAFASALASYFVTVHLKISFAGLPIGAVAGLIAGILMGMLIALAHAYACVSKMGDQVVSGVAINFFAAGFTIVMTNALFNTGDTPSIRQKEGLFSDVSLPNFWITDIPLLGDLYTKILSGQNILTWFAFMLVPIIWFLLYKTRFGLRVRAVGENPQAVDTAGISVKSLRYQSVILGGALCGIAGTFLAIAASTQFSRDMSAGRGYIALVVLILGKWRPVPTMLGCILFAFFQASSDRWLPSHIAGFGNIAPLTSVAHYVLVLILMIFIGKSIAPAAVGIPYKKER